MSKQFQDLYVFPLMRANAWRKLPILLASVIFLTASAKAKEQGCFCLQHMKTNAVRVGCEEFKLPNAPAARVKCRISVETIIREPVNNPQNYRHLSSGEGQCNPCDPPVRRGLPDSPRQP